MQLEDEKFDPDYYLLSETVPIHILSLSLSDAWVCCNRADLMEDEGVQCCLHFQARWQRELEQLRTVFCEHTICCFHSLSLSELSFLYPRHSHLYRLLLPLRAWMPVTQICFLSLSKKCKQCYYSLGKNVLLYL